MKKSVLIISVLSLLLLVACQPTAPQSREEAFVREFRVGNQGLSLRFVPNLPPQRLFSGEAFGALVEIENRGTYIVGGPGDKVHLAGFDPTIITGISSFGEQIPLLEGRTQYLPQGGLGSISFEGVTRLLQDRYPVTLIASACYGYETRAFANVCIDPNPYAPRVRQRVCVPQNVGLGGGQGAPIAVNRVEVLASPGITRFKIHVQNVGGGEVFRQGTQYLAKCSPYSEGIAYDEIDYVELTDVIVSGVSLKHSCKPLDRGHIRLNKGVGMAFCEFALPRGAAAYMTPVTIVLRYGYRNTIMHQMEILPTI